MATIVACGGFSAVCGSSLATVATMSKVAIPSMQKFGYDARLATGSVAAGGTLGILIPPSVALVFYGIMTETDIGALFAAGVIPGILGILLYAGAVAVVTKINPKLGPPGPKRPLRERIHALKGIWGMLLLFLIVMGGIYGGIFTPTEAAGIGAFGAFVIALGRRRLTVKITLDALAETGRTTAMLLSLLIGSLLFANFINVENAMKIGLLPTIDLDRVTKVGNAALDGAKLALMSLATRTRLEKLTDEVVHVELETVPEFFEIFVEGCLLKPMPDDLSGFDLNKE